MIIQVKFAKCFWKKRIEIVFYLLKQNNFSESNSPKTVARHTIRTEWIIFPVTLNICCSQ